MKRIPVRGESHATSLGWIWSKNTMTADNWLLDVKLRVTGRGRVGADGMVRFRLFRLHSTVMRRPRWTGMSERGEIGLVWF